MKWNSMKRSGMQEWQKAGPRRIWPRPQALAKALDINEDVLLDDNASFVLRANERYGSRGARQAWDMVADIAAMWSGGEMDEEDMDSIMQAMQEAYWEAKKNNRKYVPKKYRKGEEA